MIYNNAVNIIKISDILLLKKEHDLIILKVTEQYNYSVQIFQKIIYRGITEL